MMTHSSQLTAGEIALQSWDAVEGEAYEERYMFPEEPAASEAEDSEEEETHSAKERWYQYCIRIGGEEGLKEYKHAEAKLREECLWYKKSVQMKFG